MGWENRDYARDRVYSSGGSIGLSDWPPVVKFIIIANVVVFIAQIFFIRRMTPDEYIDAFIDHNNIEQVLEETGLDEKQLRQEFDNQKEELVKFFEGRGRTLLPMVSTIQEIFELNSRKAKQGQVWRVVTCGFCHDRFSIAHIGINMLVLFWFGAPIERMYGSREFAFFYAFALLTSSLFFIGLDTWTGQNIPAIGASGAVMGVFALFAIHYPRHTIRLFFIIPVEARWLLILYAIYDTHPVLLALAGQPQATGVAHAGHLGGLVFGLVYWKLQIRLSTTFLASQSSSAGYRSSTSSQPKKRDKPKNNKSKPSSLKLYDPEQESSAMADSAMDDAALESQDEFDAEVDNILRKIQQQGKKSLTEEEQKILDRASNWYKDRDKF